MQHHGHHYTHHPSSASQGSSTRFLLRGAVVFIHVPQTMSHMNDPTVEKKRPIIVLNKQVIVKVDGRGFPTAPVSFLGLDATSKDYVVMGRPTVTFHISPHKPITTFAFLDSIRTITIDQDEVRPAYQLKPPEMHQIMQGLDHVLRPEPAFHRKALYAKEKSAGKLWNIRTHGDGDVREGCVLLPRGKFFVGDSGEGSADNYHQVRHSPFLMAVFRAAAKAVNVRDLSWDDVEIRAVQDHSFVQPTGELHIDTTTGIVNNLRRQIGLPPVDCNPLPVRSASSILGHIGRSLAVGFGRRL